MEISLATSNLTVIPGFPHSPGTMPQPAGKHLGDRVSQGKESWEGRGPPARSWLTHSGDEAVVAVLLRVEDPVFDEDGDGPQHEGHEQVHVDEIAGAV